MSKKNRKRRGNPVEITNYGYGIDAAAYSPNRSFNLFPSCNGREVTRAGRQRLVSRARSLYYNSPEVRSAVKTLCMLVGTLKPLARTADEEWNRLAQDAFARRTSNPTTFELTNSLNFAQLQSYIEEKANVDGDCLVVLTTDKTGGGVAVYPSDMIKGADNNDGVVLDKYGRPKEYIITSADKETRIPAKNCILYRHNPDPTDPRGMTDLVAAITTALDIYEINTYNKTSVKLGASFGIVETVDNNVKRTDVADLRMLRNGGGMGVTTDTPAYNPLQINGVNAITLSPGHDLKTLQDNRPSNEVRNFAHDLVDSIAYSVGLDPEILYRVKEMGSASVRFSIAKAKDWARPRIMDKEMLCQRIWEHIIGCEIAAGRLRPCSDAQSAYDCQWVGTGNWSIDRGRDASAAISLVREGLMSRDLYCLENYGTTFADIARENALNLKSLVDITDEVGIPINLVMPGQVGGEQYSSVTSNNETNHDD